MSQEKRSYSRIDTRLKAHARRTSDVSSPKLFRSQSAPMASDLRNAKLPEDVVGFLQEMDRKLDTILGLLSRDQIRDDFPIDLEVIEISGAGMKFRTSEPISTNDLLEVVIVLERAPLRMAGAKGTVLTHDAGSNIYGFEFQNISDNDLEAIIQFVFGRQREQIRNARRS